MLNASLPNLEWFYLPAPQRKGSALALGFFVRPGTGTALQGRGVRTFAFAVLVGGGPAA